MIEYTTRSRIKQNLEVQKRQFEKELVQLQEKLQKQQQQAAAAAAAAAARAEEKAANSASTTTRSYSKDITVYGMIRVSPKFFFL